MTKSSFNAKTCLYSLLPFFILDLSSSFGGVQTSKELLDNIKLSCARAYSAL